ncbi:glycosyltransferase family A protein [Pseudokineococcus basanitobsidens]|uniref:Glycosyltransferase family A protein n=1 Tax=Pseudokineococcus basanitobsidens TaxID=1926649 RepID=A0ABU8RI38_9ACTN
MNEAKWPAVDKRIPNPRSGGRPTASWPSVTVVVPTTLRRASLPPALRSAREQDYPGDVVVTVVVDRDRSDTRGYERAWLAEADHVIWTGGGALGGRSRNLGVAAAETDLVAFLDDDDLWRPMKLSLQVRRLVASEGHGAAVVVGSRVVEVRCDTQERSRPVPTSLIAADESVGDYLFRRRRPSLGRASLHTSTLLMRRSTAVAVPWSEGLARHQDWDWLLRAEDSLGAVVVQVAEVTVEHYLGSVASVSASADWRSSLEWAAAWRSRWSARTYSDFVCGQALRYAVQARSSAGVRTCLAEVRRSGSLPAPGPAVLAAGSLVPRPLLERFSHRAHRLASSAGRVPQAGRGIAAIPAPRRPGLRSTPGPSTAEALQHAGARKS